MKRYCCPLSLDASRQIKELSESYRLAIAAASDYNSISLASRKQIEAAIARADRLGEAIDCYLNGWQCGIPCLLYSCGWEYCRRNLELLNGINKLPRPFAGTSTANKTAARSQSTADSNQNVTYIVDNQNPQLDSGMHSENEKPQTDAGDMQVKQEDDGNAGTGQ